MKVIDANMYKARIVIIISWIWGADYKFLPRLLRKQEGIHSTSYSDLQDLYLQINAQKSPTWKLKGL